MSIFEVKLINSVNFSISFHGQIYDEYLIFEKQTIYFYVSI